MVTLNIISMPLLAQISPAVEAQPVAKPIVLMMVLVILSLAPFLLMMTSSFVKISVVLGLVRSALGTQQIPPNQIVTGLALILTVYIMIPVGTDVYRSAEGVIRGADTNQPLLSTASVDVLKKAMDVGKEPLRAFLMKHSSPKDRNLFFGMAKQLRGKREDVKMEEKDFIVIIPAFIITELSEAFQIGFILFLPFLVIDMVVSNILLAMGMFMVSPVTVSLPFKLLLFVLVDGWYLITKGLILGYV
ncbi:MAG: type III secretion system export apparatus subunit SctR [Deltaproteobacteria bacterium]|nr:type III secretion system export apparatus subunit SctR [Deltaproteobacteria bacterium]